MLIIALKPINLLESTPFLFASPSLDWLCGQSILYKPTSMDGHLSFVKAAIGHKIRQSLRRQIASSLGFPPPQALFHNA